MADKIPRYNGRNVRDKPHGTSHRVNKHTKAKVQKSGQPQEPWQKKGKSSARDGSAGITGLKHRLRSLNRLLANNSKLPADIRLGHEREIQALQHELVGLLLDKEKHDMIGRYHKVRFFERQKATRHLKKARKELEEAHDKSHDLSSLQKQAHIAQVNVNYTQYYPYMTVYQSLWKREKDNDGAECYIANGEQEDGARGNVEIWRQVESAMTAGTLEKLKDQVDPSRIDRIRETVLSISKVSTGFVKARPGTDREAEEDEDEDETGAGFFD